MKGLVSDMRLPHILDFTRRNNRKIYERYPLQSPQANDSIAYQKNPIVLIEAPIVFGNYCEALVAKRCASFRKLTLNPKP